MSGNNADRLDQFVVVSRMLLELDELPSALAGVYLGMVDERWPIWPLADMAATFAQWRDLPAETRERLIIEALGANEWLPYAEGVLNVWFSGQLFVDDTNTTFVDAPAEAYLGALVWGLLHTHPSGMPGPFFGEWAYPPSDDITWVHTPSPTRRGAR
ncbi:MAG: hypothetical protein RLZZ623_2532 [Actinomycetota bacterium]